jgi:hypothetical protein
VSAPASAPASVDPRPERAAQIQGSARAPRSSVAPRPHGWITVQSGPPRAHIRIGARDLGQAPVVRYRLPPGRYVVEATRADGTRQHRRVRIEAGRAALVTFR